jgi:hypothetical protein
MRRVIAPVLFLVLLAAAGCGGTTAGSPGADAGAGGAADAEAGVGGAGDTVPGCPFTATQVSDIIGQPMTDEGNCLFGDGKGVASLTITVSSKTAGATTFAYQRDRAEKVYDRVTDSNKGDKAYVAAKDIEAEAVVVSDKGSYTLIMSSFSTDPAAYEQTLRKLLDAILA